MGEGEDIARVITQISQDYEQYSRQACRMFEKHLDFDRAFHEVIRRIESLGENGFSHAEASPKETAML